MDTFWNIIQEHFVWGLALGLGVALFVWKSGFSTKRQLSRDVRRLENELRDLQKHLNTQLKINSEGNRKLEAELDALREHNENLRVSMATLQNKPGRSEIRQYHILEAAARRMRERIPAFSSAWEQALREAEDEVEAGETGLRRLVRKAFPGIGMTAAAHADESDKDEKS